MFDEVKREVRVAILELIRREREGEIVETLKKAVEISLAEPMGPVHLDLPEDVALALAGGALMGFGAKLARGCTSGQALISVRHAGGRPSTTCWSTTRSPRIS